MEESYSQNDISPGTMAGLEQTLIELESKFINKNENKKENNKEKKNTKRKTNPVTIEEAKKNVNSNNNHDHNHNHNQYEDKRRKLNQNKNIINDLNISKIKDNNDDDERYLNPTNLNQEFDQNQTLNLSVLNENNKQIIKQLQGNIKAINNINGNLSRMSSLKIAEEIEDENL